MEKRTATRFEADRKDRGDEKQETQVFWLALQYRHGAEL